MRCAPYINSWLWFTLQLSRCYTTIPILLVTSILCLSIITWCSYYNTSRNKISASSHLHCLVQTELQKCPWCRSLSWCEYKPVNCRSKTSSERWSWFASGSVDVWKSPVVKPAHAHTAGFRSHRHYWKYCCSHRKYSRTTSDHQASVSRSHSSP